MYIQNETVMQQVGEWIGERLQGGELLELIGDVGAGKTTFTRGLARGLDIAERIQSPTFTVSREYSARDNLRLVHYDFYRLSEAGIMDQELSEVVDDSKAVVVIEWSAAVKDVLPVERITITIKPTADDEQMRRITWTGDEQTRSILEECEHVFTAWY